MSSGWVIGVIISKDEASPETIMIAVFDHAQRWLCDEVVITKGVASTHAWRDATRSLRDIR